MIKKIYIFIFIFFLSLTSQAKSYECDFDKLKPGATKIRDYYHNVENKPYNKI